MIDPGHGGKDPGCHGVTFKEKNIALAVSLKLGHFLQDNDKNVKVVFTRTTDIFVALNERADIANKNHADVFICVHLNASPNHEANGSATYVMGLKKSEGNLEIEKQENSAILYEKDYKTTYGGFDPNSSEANIIFSMYQNLFLTQSLDLSTKIQEEYSHIEKRKDNGVKQAGFLVLWKTAMPSLLTEIGFLTNPDEEKYMGTSKGEDAIAKSIFLAFEQYKSEKDNTPYDPSKFTYGEYSVKISDTTAVDTNQPNPEKDSIPNVDKKGHPTDSSFKKDTPKPHNDVRKDTSSTQKPKTHTSTKQPQAKDSTAQATKKDTAQKAVVVWHEPPRRPVIKDTTAVKVDRMKEAAKKLKQDSMPPPKKDSVAVNSPKKKPDSVTAKKTEPVKTTTVTDTTQAYFTVQFTLADHQLAKDDKRFAGLNDIDYYLDNKVYKYTAGHFSKLQDAVDLQSKLRDKGFKDSFVIAFRGKKRITIKEAKGEK